MLSGIRLRQSFNDNAMARNRGMPLTGFARRCCQSRYAPSFTIYGLYAQHPD